MVSRELLPQEPSKTYELSGIRITTGIGKETKGIELVRKKPMYSVKAIYPRI